MRTASSVGVVLVPRLVGVTLQIDFRDDRVALGAKIVCLHPVGGRPAYALAKNSGIAGVVPAPVKTVRFIQGEPVTPGARGMTGAGNGQNSENRNNRRQECCR
ncbi:hypothetical protein F4212_03720 [Candidatus Poribacteria bacterium]|nr:hypothetical protein [Candidatus Poribacteria bacterium]